LNPPNLQKSALLKGSQEERTQSERKGPVLVVEDDPDILSSVADILDFEGYAVETAIDGSVALSILEKVQPTLILLDMRMPVLNGWEFARILKERNIKVPILVMTAAQDARRWAEEIGAEGYIPKPFHVMDLLNAVAKFHDQF
jgi:DNA-binding response OmpR family regulator